MLTEPIDRSPVVLTSNVRLGRARPRQAKPLAMLASVVPRTSFIRRDVSRTTSATGKCATTLANSSIGSGWIQLMEGRYQTLPDAAHATSQRGMDAL
jgi:hypothetical protein